MKPTPRAGRQIERLKKLKATYELKATQYLMKANDIEEKICSLMPRETRTTPEDS